MVIGALYERLGRLVGRSYEETVPLLLKILKNGDSQMRFEIMFALERIANGLGSAGGNTQREIFKVAKAYVCDRAMPVRSASAMVDIDQSHNSIAIFPVRFFFSVSLHSSIKTILCIRMNSKAM